MKKTIKLLVFFILIPILLSILTFILAVNQDNFVITSKIFILLTIYLFFTCKFIYILPHFNFFIILLSYINIIIIFLVEGIFGIIKKRVFLTRDIQKRDVNIYIGIIYIAISFYFFFSFLSFLRNNVLSNYKIKKDKLGIFYILLIINICHFIYYLSLQLKY